MLAPVDTFDSRYDAIRHGVGLLESSARGKLWLTERDALEYLHSQLTNDIEALAAGSGCYAALLTAKGRILADMRVLRHAEGLWIDCEPACFAALKQHLGTYRIGRSVEIADLSEAKAVLTVLGPRANALVAEICGNVDLPDNEHDHVGTSSSELKLTAVAVSHPASGFDLICDTSAQVELGNRLLAGGAKKVGPAVVECTRVEAGLPRYGMEITAETMPSEVGIVERAVNFEKGCYIGQEVVARTHYRGHPNRSLRGLLLTQLAMAGDDLCTDSGRQVGVITSVTNSPRFGPIALTVLRREVAVGDTVQVAGSDTKAEVVELPFDRQSVS